MYIPVEEATDGGTPILSKRGLKIIPPPKPKAPDTQPPKEAKTTSLVTLLPLKIISDSIKPLPTFSFNLYSLFRI